MIVGKTTGYENCLSRALIIVEKNTGYEKCLIRAFIIVSNEFLLS